MPESRPIRALFVDIDDTILRARVGPGEAAGHALGMSMMDVLEEAAVRMLSLPREEARRRIDRVNNEVLWWHWSDFIVELGLPPKAFWEFAYEEQSAYLEPTGDEIDGALDRLAAAGYLLYVTSNNPSSGILHKLRLAGLATNQGAPRFHQLLGATELHAMKWDREYWQKALAHTALEGEEVAVIGDNPRDDYEVPRSVGYRMTFLINREEDLSAQNREDLRHVTSFDQIADALTVDGVRCPIGAVDA